MKRLIENYHTHTFRCNHASGVEREYVEKAIAEGLEVMGFADHVPYRKMKCGYSGFRMKPEQTKDYVDTINALKKEYEGKIKILLGYSIFYFPFLFFIITIIVIVIIVVAVITVVIVSVVVHKFYPPFIN